MENRAYGTHTTYWQVCGEVGVTGFEPVTLRLSSACSNQLSYTPEKHQLSEQWRLGDSNP
jgi:hypothetical protein